MGGGEGLREMAMVEHEGEGEARDGGWGRLVGVERVGVVWRCKVGCDGEDIESCKPMAAGATGSVGTGHEVETSVSTTYDGGVI